MEHNPSLTPTYLAAAVDKSVKFAARDTIQLNGRRDRNCRYARIPDGTACDFCRMLGSRGFVYRSEFAAGGGNDYHPYCNCQVAVCFDPFIDKYDVVSESGTITTVTRGYGDGELVRPGRDGSYELRDVDIDALYDEYKAMGKKFTAKSKYKDYTRGAKLTDEQFDAAMRRLSEARTLEELHEVGKDIVDNWPANANGHDKAQWDEMSRHARELEKALREHDSVSGVSAAVDPEIRAWAKQFPNEELRVERESGKPFYKEGSPTEVKTTDEEDATFRNGKAKHTHTTEIGGTFGEDDIWFTTGNWLAEHEAEDVYRGRSYKLVRKSDATEEKAEEFAKKYEAVSFENYDRLLGEIYDSNGGDATHGYGPTLEEKIEAEKRLKPIQHQWLKDNAGKWGYDYSYQT